MNAAQFYYITIATQPHVILDRIQCKIAEQNEKIIVLGKEENRAIGWNSTGNFGVKLKEVRDFLSRDYVNDEDIVLFTDAYDVLYYGSFPEILKRFGEFHKPIVFGCETTCNPIPSLAAVYEEKECEFPFLNSGMFIGRVWALRKCISDYKYNDKDDDQAFWTLQFLKENRDLIELDYNNRLFLNTYGIDLTLITRYDRNMCSYKNKNPLFVHVNGPVKSDLDYFL